MARSEEKARMLRGTPLAQFCFDCTQGCRRPRRAGAALSLHGARLVTCTMSDIMAPGNATAFDMAHITELLANRADRLAPLLDVALRRRVLLHRHIGFATNVPVNDRARLSPSLPERVMVVSSAR